MKKFGKAFAAAAKGLASEFGPSRYSAAGKEIRCSHCNGDLFTAHEALLNTTGASLIGLDWLNKSGTALLCEECGLIQWFGRKPQRQQSPEP
jgi:hypothetical protein